MNALRTSCGDCKRRPMDWPECLVVVGRVAIVLFVLRGFTEARFAFSTRGVCPSEANSSFSERAFWGCSSACTGCIAGVASSIHSISSGLKGDSSSQSVGVVVAGSASFLFSFMLSHTLRAMNITPKRMPIKSSIRARILYINRPKVRNFFHISCVLAIFLCFLGNSLPMRWHFGKNLSKTKENLSADRENSVS